MLQITLASYQHCFEPGGTVEASSPYGAWREMLGSMPVLEVGDLLEGPDGSLRIYKYVGFEEARWVLPEVKTGMEGLPPAAGSPEAPPASA